MSPRKEITWEGNISIKTAIVFTW